jgi:hypothetical protein
MVSRATDMTFDARASAESIAMIWRHWQARDGSVLVPGHDLPMTQREGSTTYLGTREASIRAWYGDDLEQTTLYRLHA